MRKVIIVGATSGIGRGLAELYVSQGYLVGIIGRRENLLKELYCQNQKQYFYRVGDVYERSIIYLLDSIYKELGGLDLLIISAGSGELNTQLDYHLEESSINTNIVGFTNVVDWGYRIFETQKRGHLVVISSIAGIRGSGVAPAYNASKAYQMNYLEGLRQKVFRQRIPIHITDVRPGFVDTAMAKGAGLFWITPLNKAVYQIYAAITQEKRLFMFLKDGDLLHYY